MTMDGNLKMSVEAYDNMIGMMNSPDHENIVVALECLENMDFKTNMVPIILLLKHTSVKENSWISSAPKTYNHLRGMGYDIEQPITYKRILSTMNVHALPEEDYDFYFKVFARYLKSSIREMGFDFIDTLEITVTYKK